MIVGVRRLELPTSTSRTWRASQLCYTPGISPLFYWSNGYFDDKNSIFFVTASPADRSMNFIYKAQMRKRLSPGCIINAILIEYCLYLFVRLPVEKSVAGTSCLDILHPLTSLYKGIHKSFHIRILHDGIICSAYQVLSHGFLKIDPCLVTVYNINRSKYILNYFYNLAYL